MPSSDHENVKAMMGCFVLVAILSGLAILIGAAVWVWRAALA